VATSPSRKTTALFNIVGAMGRLLEHEDGAIVFRHACQLGYERIVSKRLGSRYRSGRSHDWLKMKNANAPAAEED
jgi:ATP-dependent DNA ligase